MKELHIDIESYSSADLGKCGVYKYAEAEDFEILLFAYSEDGKEVKVVDLAKGKKIPHGEKIHGHGYCGMRGRPVPRDVYVLWGEPFGPLFRPYYTAPEFVPEQHGRSG